jgi:hypothetical protein
MKKIATRAISFVIALTLIGSVAAQEKKESKKALAKEAKITLKQAREAALKAAPGKIKEEELERENGKLVYSFDIRTKESTKEVQINAIDGSVVSVETETAADEAKEKAAEKNKAKTKTKKP